MVLSLRAIKAPAAFVVLSRPPGINPKWAWQRHLVERRVGAKDQAVVEVQRTPLADAHHNIVLGHLPLTPSASGLNDGLG